MLPIGDPAVLWRHTVCLNTIVHRLRYTLTVAVCARVPRKAAAPACFSGYAGSREFVSADGQEDCEYDLQLLSRHVHVSLSSLDLYAWFLNFLTNFSNCWLLFILGNDDETSRQCTHRLVADVWTRRKDLESGRCTPPCVGPSTISPR